MSKMYDLRAALKTAIVAADIGFVDEAVLIRRQGSFWNQVASAISNAKHGSILHIGIASGKPTEEESLEMELSIPLTIIAKPQVGREARPEEDLWEDLVTTVHDLRLPGTGFYKDRLIFDGFQDIDIVADGGTAYLGRQTIFKCRLSL